MHKGIAAVTVASVLGIAPAALAETYSTVDTIQDANGVTHVRQDLTYKGLQVLGGDRVVHEGAVTPVSQTLTAPLPANVTPQVSRDTATRAGMQAARVRGGTNGEIRQDAKPQLVIEARTGEPRLAYLTRTAGTQADGTPSLIEATVDAKTGEVLMAVQQIETDAGTGRTLYAGTVTTRFDTTRSGSSYTLTDPLRGNTRTTDAANKTDLCIGTFCVRRAPQNPFTDADNVWGSGTTADRATVAADVHYGVATTWDYYKNTFGRTGIAGDGKGSYSRVHYGSGYDNAFWDDSCFCMTYGDGASFGPLVSLDVTGHEMSHGVTSRTAALTYSGESGGLNESTSDIFGTLVEFYAANPSDPGDYLIGEKPGGAGGPLRYMDQPSKDGSSADCWSTAVKNLDVHYSSGVGNHFFYLLAVGSGPSAFGNSPTCNGSTVTGIGNAAAGAIWYRALTTYMTSSTDFHGARVASLNAAGDLYGAGSAQYNAVNAAWAGVGVTA
ncbi:MAG: zinc metalloprotease ZmpA [Solirubrobacteraceae bacterium]|nr:zinc metalloprotease ZmpA [Solirubrobacteraceae bacterium]